MQAFRTPTSLRFLLVWGVLGFRADVARASVATGAE